MFGLRFEVGFVLEAKARPPSNEERNPEKHESGGLAGARWHGSLSHAAVLFSQKSRDCTSLSLALSSLLLLIQWT